MDDNFNSTMAAKFKMSDEEMERELERKFERNRIAFEGWLERKKEEQKVLIGLNHSKLL